MASTDEYAARRQAGRRARTGLVLLLVVIILVIYGVLASTNGWFPFAAPASSAPTQALPPAAAQVVRLRGSNTVGETLAPNLAKAYLAGKGATDVSARGFVQDGVPTVAVTGTVPGRGPTSFEIQAQGTETGFAALAAGSGDIGMASHEVTGAERQQLTGRGDMTSTDSEIPFAFDAVSVIVNRGRGVTELSVGQLRDVFSCRVTDWSRLVPGQPAGPIRVLARNDDSGTYETFRDKVLGTTPLCPGAQRFDNNTDLSHAVETDQSAIGFVPLPSIGGNTALALYDGQSAPTPPTEQNIATETYLLTRRLYLYVPTVPPNPLAADFADTFARSMPGQQVVAGAGFVNTYYRPPTPPVTRCAPGRPADYCAAVTGAMREPFDVHFESGTDRLDNLATRDLDLLAATVGQAGNGRQLLAVGFADNAGDPQANQELSQTRAASVVRYLDGHGVPGVAVAAFGAESPVDTNATPEGREKNRRVELWLR